MFNSEGHMFFHTLKTELLYHTKFQDKADAEQALFNYIEVYYNRRRRHSTNGYRSPASYEAEWKKMQHAA